jgi:DNA-binding response OmpR family regulator
MFYHPRETWPPQGQEQAGACTMSPSLRILLVDDNRDTAESLALLCQCWGHEVVLAHDGPSAVAMARECQPDVVLLDIGLPGLDGFEVTERLRALRQFADTHIIATSGFSRDKDRCRAREVGIDVYLVKPFDPWQLEKIFASCRTGPEAVPA